MAAKDRKALQKELSTKLAEEPDSWAALVEWANACGDLCRQIAEDYQETYDNIPSQGLQDSWEEQHGEGKEHFEDCAQSYEEGSYDPTDSEPAPVLTDEHSKDSYWDDVMGWLEDRVTEVREAIGAYEIA